MPSPASGVVLSGEIPKGQARRTEAAAALCLNPPALTSLKEKFERVRKKAKSSLGRLSLQRRRAQIQCIPPFVRGRAAPYSARKRLQGTNACAWCQRQRGVSLYDFFLGWGALAERKQKKFSGPLACGTGTMMIRCDGSKRRPSVSVIAKALALSRRCAALTSSNKPRWFASLRCRQASRQNNATVY